MKEPKLLTEGQRNGLIHRINKRTKEVRMSIRKLVEEWKSFCDDGRPPRDDLLSHQERCAEIRGGLRKARSRLAELEEGVINLRNGFNGRCRGKECGRPIGIERLREVPTAILCSRCERHKEKGTVVVKGHRGTVVVHTDTPHVS